jgi:hypothetical protein
VDSRHNVSPHAQEVPVDASKFTGKHEHRVIEGGIWHNLPQAFAEAIIDADSY